MSCRQCEGIERKFDRRKAEKQLRRVAWRGPLANTHRLIEQLRPHLLEGDSLLDIGGGVGTIHHVLLDAGVCTAVHLDASSGYIAVARDEAARRGHADRVRFIHGDFVEVADSISSADIVTLDRVICCDPDVAAMVSRAAEKTRRVLGAVYPRERWWVRASIALENLMSRLRRSTFRMYLHSPVTIEARFRAHGFERASVRRTAYWEITTYARRS